MGQFVAMYLVCEDSFVEYAVVKTCRARESVYMKPDTDSYDFTYVYDYLFKEYNIMFPLTDFEAGMLNLMNIAPSNCIQTAGPLWNALSCFVTNSGLSPP